MIDDGWHGSEDYPGPTVSNSKDFNEWAAELGWPRRGWPKGFHRKRTSLTAFLMWVLLTSGIGMVWGGIAFLVKGLL